MEKEFQEPDQPKEFYLDLYKGLLIKAKQWSEGRAATNIIKIPEKNLEEHFEKNWKDNDHQYITLLLEWRGEDDDEVTVLPIIESEQTGKKTYIADTNDLIIGKKDGDFLFRRVGRCLGFVFDITNSDGQDLRIVYHMPGSRTQKPHNMESLVDTIKQEGNLKSVILIYNSQRQTSLPDEKLRNLLPEETPLTIIDMNKKDDCLSHDLILSGNSAQQYYNQGTWDQPHGNRQPKVFRHFSGNWDLP